MQKYGGSSVADAEKILGVSKKVSKKVKEGYKVAVVVSAMGKTTDNLISLAKQINPSPNARELDMLLATGEQMSASLLSMALHKLKIISKSLNAFQAQISTEGNFNQARIKDFNTKKILQLFSKNDVLVVTGFQGITADGEITTLGRGGSDTSAVALAAALNADCEIYSDVAGIYSTDPKLFSQAKKREFLSYDEMLELSASGAKVLHSRSVEIAKKFNITIYCGSTFSDEKGSYVMSEDKIIEKEVVTGLTVQENQTQVVLKNLPLDYSLIRKLFHKVAVAGFNVDMISIIADENGLNVSFTIIDESKKSLATAIKKVLKDLSKYTMEFYSGFIKVTVVGIGMKSSTGVASDFFTAMKNIPIRLVTTSEIKISCLIEKVYLSEAVKSLAKKFKL
ncbi:MAG: aspartate kinase [Ignavibacteriaceae bacterium]